MRRVVWFVLGYILIFGTYFTYTQYNPALFQAPVLDTNTYTNSFDGIESNEQFMYRWLFHPLNLSIPPITTPYRIVRIIGAAVQDVNTVDFRISASESISAPVQGQVFRRYQILLPDDSSTSLWPSPTQLSITPQSFQQVEKRRISLAIHSITIEPTQPLPIPPIWVILAVSSMLGMLFVFAKVLTPTIEHSFWLLVIIGIYSLALVQAISMLMAVIAITSMLTLYIVYRYVSPLYTRLTHELPTIPASTTYRSDIDGLRALAVVAVVIYHAFPEVLPGGFIGVDIFFVISGYLITRIIIEEVSTQRFSIRQFYVRRIRRIFPALIIVLITTEIIGGYLLFQSEYTELGTHILAGAGFVSNIVFYQQVDYFGELSINQPLLHLWSLGVEEQFYIVWPVVLWFATKRPKLLIPSLIVLLITSFLMYMHTATSDAPAAFYLLASRFWQIAIGGFIAFHTLLSPVSTSRHPDYISTIIPATGIILYMYGIFTIHESGEYTEWNTLIPTISGVCLVYPHAKNWISNRFLSHPLLVWVGKVSFPFYLWHWPLLSFGFLTLDIGFTPVLKLGVIGFSAFLASVTYLYVERPLRFSHAKIFKTWLLVVMMLGIGGSGWMIQNEYIIGYLPKFTVPRASEFIKRQQCDSIFFIQPEYHLDGCTMRTGPIEQSEYVIIGDSHAFVFTSGMITASKNQVMLFSSSGCLPLIGIDRRSMHCRKTSQLPQVFQYLRDNPTTHKHRYIVIAGRFSYIEPNSLNRNVVANEQLSMAGISIEETKTNPERIIETGLRNNLMAISGLPNTTIVILHQVPELQYSPKTCMRLLLITKTNDTQTLDSLCQTPYSLVQQHFSRYRHAVQQVLVDYPEVKEFNADSLFCNQEKCVSTIDGTLDYVDHNHLSHRGATRVAQLFINTYP